MAGRPFFVNAKLDKIYNPRQVLFLVVAGIRCSEFAENFAALVVVRIQKKTISHLWGSRPTSRQ